MSNSLLTLVTTDGRDETMDPNVNTAITPADFRSCILKRSGNGDTVRSKREMVRGQCLNVCHLEGDSKLYILK